MDKKKFTEILEKIKSSPDDAKNYYDLGNVFHEDLNFTQAIVAFTKCIELDPTNTQFYDSRSYMYETLNYFDKAVADLGKAIELKPDSGYFYFCRACVYEEFEDYENAVKDFLKLIELNYFQKNRDWNYHLGENYLKLRYYSKALEHFKRCSKIESAAKKCAEVEKLFRLNELKFCDRNIFKFSCDKKIESEEFFIENDIFMANQKLKLAQKNFDSKKFYNAIAFCNQSLQLNPKNNLQANLLLGRAYLELFDDKAFEIFDLIIAMNPNFAAGYFYKGLAIVKLENNFELAIKNFDKAIELEKNSKFYFWRGFAHSFLRNYSAAIDDFNISAELNPEEKNIFKHRGFAYLELKNFDKAVADFNNVIKFSPDDETYYWRALTYANLQNKNLALKDLDKFSYLQSGEIFYLLGEYDKAIENFSKHIELHKISIADFYFRGKTFFAMNDYKNALTDLEKYISVCEDLAKKFYKDFPHHILIEAKNLRDLCKNFLK